eukprot:Lithocolla_globosa_v1_NODE_526_length_3808_cov_6.745004.p2 type:complete len:179 gc:universal NODE_526_length_3808_cov_6.745004:1970-2506(+)
MALAGELTKRTLPECWSRKARRESFCFLLSRGPHSSSSENKVLGGGLEGSNDFWVLSNDFRASELRLSIDLRCCSGEEVSTEPLFVKVRFFFSVNFLPVFGDDDSSSFSLICSVVALSFPFVSLLLNQDFLFAFLSVVTCPILELDESPRESGNGSNPSTISSGASAAKSKFVSMTST